MNAAELISLRKEYKNITAVKDVSFTIKDGEVFALLGMNGAGKTTILKMLSCLTKPTKGDALVFGKSSALRPIIRFVYVQYLEKRLIAELKHGTLYKFFVVFKRIAVVFYQKRDFLF